MSFEYTHITRHNYEEFFLLYVDNELSVRERKEVESFIATHPDLAEELDLLSQATVLQPLQQGLGDKSFLMAESMKMNNIDDSLMLYFDNELTAPERKKVEAEMNSRPEYKREYDQLLQTRLSKETITYPYKSELYRRTESRPVAYWMRIAAAAIVMFALGLIYLLNEGQEKAPTVASIPAGKELVKPDQQQIVLAPTEKEKDPVTNHARRDRIAIPPVPLRSKALENLVITPESPKKETQQPIIEAPSPVKRNEDVKTNGAVATSGNTAIQNINAPVVTTETGAAYSSIDTPVTTPQDNAVTDHQKGSSVRGLLRKATRFIEKRTGVNPVNDDDELLIGALAIKLK